MFLSMLKPSTAFSISDDTPKMFVKTLIEIFTKSQSLKALGILTFDDDEDVHEVVAKCCLMCLICLLCLMCLNERL